MEKKKLNLAGLSEPPYQRIRPDKDAHYRITTERRIKFNRNDANGKVIIITNGGIILRSNFSSIRKLPKCFECQTRLKDKTLSCVYTTLLIALLQLLLLGVMSNCIPADLLYTACCRFSIRYNVFYLCSCWPRSVQTVVLRADYTDSSKCN